MPSYGPGWKSYAYMASLALLFPSTIGLLLWRDKQLSIPWLSIFGLLYLWTTANIVYPFFTSPLRHLPSPPNEWFLFGHGPVMLKRPPGEIFSGWMQQIPNDGLIHFRSFFHWRSRVVPTTPEALAEILTARPYDWEKPAPAKRFLARVIGHGLINADGAEHKMQRKAATPAFSGKQIRDLVPVFWGKALKFADAIVNEWEVDSETDEKSAGGGASRERSGVIEIGAITSRITLDVIGEAGVGKDFNTITNADDELAQQYAIITATDRPMLVLYFAVNMFLPPWVARSIPWKINQIIAEASLNVRKISKRLVAEKKVAMAEKTGSHVDILSVLIKSGSFDDIGLVDQLLTMLAAGHETTSSALMWATYLLATHTDIQTQLRDEVRKHVSETGSLEVMDAATLDAMPFGSAVCNEVLRLFPTIPVTARVAAKETRIGQQVIPKGTHAVMVPWSINRLESLWPDATSFNPHRWMKDGQANLGGAASPYSMLTFLHGPRSCIGQQFARTEIKCLLAVLVYRFDIALADPSQAGKAIPAGIVAIKPQGGMRLRLTERA